MPSQQPTVSKSKHWRQLKALVCRLNTMLNEIWLTVPSWKMAGICDSADDDGVDAGNMAAVVREIRVIRSLSISRYVAAHEWPPLNWRCRFFRLPSVLLETRNTSCGMWYLPHGWVRYDWHCHLVFTSQLLWFPIRCRIDWVGFNVPLNTL